VIHGVPSAVKSECPVIHVHVYISSLYIHIITSVLLMREFPSHTFCSVFVCSRGFGFGFGFGVVWLVLFSFGLALALALLLLGWFFFALACLMESGTGCVR